MVVWIVVTDTAYQSFDRMSIKIIIKITMIKLHKFSVSIIYVKVFVQYGT